MVRVVLGCVCGSDLWYYRGESRHAVGSIGHEFIGVVDQVGADVRAIRPGRVFDYETDLAHIADAYRAMDERRATTSPSTRRSGTTGSTPAPG